MDTPETNRPHLVPVRTGKLRDLEPAIARPREKLLKYGSRALTNTELLAVLLGSGVEGGNVLQVAEDLMRRHGAEALPGLSLEAWRSSRGIGIVKACQLTAAFELARRILVRSEGEFRVGSPREAYDLVRDLKRARKEHLVALYLDAQNFLIRRETITIGSLNTTRTHPREILQPAILHSALSFVLVHNHPSGSLEPSRDDLDFTRSIARAADLMGVTLADHLIVSPRGYVSLKERGAL
ncbi:MAG TPA: DNA repair protein RadC [Candidatus Polarisedimenticolia bacterium]|jgi:DNA repair protein RadC|nr:DNA repair protein RadC [Candidatus Polarisedimenticolia bacterium]